MIRLKNLFLLLLPLLFFACGETSTPDSSSGSDAAAKTEQGISFQVDGQDWISKMGTGAILEEASGRKVISINGVGGFEGQAPGMFGIKIFGFDGAGTYETDGDAVKMMISLAISKGEKQGSYLGGVEGDKVKITDYDAATQTVSGTFDFKLKANQINFTDDTSPEYVAITNGVFNNVKLQVANM